MHNAQLWKKAAFEPNSRVFEKKIKCSSTACELQSSRGRLAECVRMGTGPSCQLRVPGCSHPHLGCAVEEL